MMSGVFFSLSFFLFFFFPFLFELVGASTEPEMAPVRGDREAYETKEKREQPSPSLRRGVV
ncbi:hypothetical protein SODALDRAFT_332023 [Sodiomyces alkalinus F11]|uniref:Secreted protein n=1 Tax=Sodiomyces alkalinus (strain CBS 110278 / VKM F-3762 / F11) TaxID=1314773 RepID=A0A3N2PZD2_SODAK|nr:hypothetical protein SODALDRAFT_332023 [Sodiomyces alkalinus F11]ROT39883.1 hypothetical protein SODALDRAFT_332023 [Sodiomyces alkalinus F11]